MNHKTDLTLSQPAAGDLILRRELGDARAELRSLEATYPANGPYANYLDRETRHLRTVIYRLEQRLHLAREPSRTSIRRESLIDTAFLWKEYVGRCGCRFDAEQKALDAVVFTQAAGGQTLAIPSKLGGVSRRQPTLAAIRRAQARELWQSLTLTLVRDRGFDEVLAIWWGRLVGTVRAKHVAWLTPLLGTRLVGCYVLQITGGTPGRDTMGCNVAFTGIGQALAAHLNQEVPQEDHVTTAVAA